ncbi:hypothetical protein EYC80_006125 [Monilinia laxa]|uniref:Uncharacterized protein n=1 Tax=Monilinia laxa TaxID=61186 RepID=A0A5N6KHS0_MONLA|nr:hypothetical protein EYC80_006125 [Monilinia laxa]
MVSTYGWILEHNKECPFSSENGKYGLGGGAISGRGGLKASSTRMGNGNHSWQVFPFVQDHGILRKPLSYGILTKSSCMLNQPQLCDAPC